MMKVRDVGMIGAQKEEEVALRVPIDLEEEVRALRSVTNTEETEKDPTEDSVQELMILRGMIQTVMRYYIYYVLHCFQCKLQIH